MKHVVFIRHAKSSWADFSLKDFDRPLDQKGLNDAPLMAQSLKNKLSKLDLIISSPAKRTTQTANFFSEALGTEIIFKSNLYHGDPYEYIEAIGELDENISTVALVGHNPAMTEIANMVSKKFIADLPTCSIVITRHSQPWSKIQFSDLNLEEIITPKELNY